MTKQINLPSEGNIVWIDLYSPYGHHIRYEGIVARVETDENNLSRGLIKKLTLEKGVEYSPNVIGLPRPFERKEFHHQNRGNISFVDFSEVEKERLRNVRGGVIFTYEI